MAQERPAYTVSLVRKDAVLESSFEEIRILYVIDGAVKLFYENTVSVLKKHDFILINVQHEAQIKIDRTAFAALLSVRYFDLLSAFDRTSLRFALDSTRGGGGPYRELQYLLQGFFMCSLGESGESGLRAEGLFLLILQTLKNHFLLSEEQVRPEDERKEKALEILRYIRANYRENISMTEIADRLYLSRSAASRLFKQYTGEAFPDYLKELRLDVVRQELASTEKSVTEIAVSSGFSSASVLNRTFRESFGISPLEYRRTHRAAAPEREETEDAEDAGRKQAVDILASDIELGIMSSEDVELVEVSMKESVPWEKWKNRLLNVGDISMLQSAAMQQQILFLQERLGIEYLRVWNVFSQKSMIFGEEPGTFNYSFIDEMLDFCVDHRLKLMLDLALRRDRALASGRREIYGRSSEIRFESRGEWRSAVEQLVRHFRSRYGESVARSWIYEFGFFLNDRPFYEGRDYRPVNVFEETAGLIKSILPGARIAGPGLILAEQPAEDRNDIYEFIQLRTPPDIFTGLHFPYLRKTRNPYFGVFEKDPDHQAVVNQIQNVRTLLTEGGFRGEYWVTETGISLANRSYIQDSCYRGAAIVESLLATQGMTDSFGIFYASDLLNVFRDTRAVLSGSGGLLSRNGFCKPAYYGFRFIRQLGDRLIEKKRRYVVTENEPGDYRILCWNKKNLGMNYYLSDEDDYRPEDLGELYQDLDPHLMEMVFRDLEPGQHYRIRQRILNKDKGSLVQKWIDLGCSDSLSRDDLEYLDQASTPEVLADVRTAEEGVLRISFRMEPNELRMIRISKE